MNLAKESRPSKTETTYNDQPLVRQGRRNWLNLIPGTTLQYMMNVKLSKQRIRHCYENGLIKTIQTIPHNLWVSVKLISLYCGLRIILVYPNPQ